MSRSDLFVLAIVLSIQSLGQTTVVSDEYLVSTRAERYQWTINGVTFNPKLEGTIIHPNRSGMDTIIFTDKSDDRTPDTILTRLPLDQELIMTISCCDAYFDIFRKDKNPMAMEPFDDSTFMASKECGEVRFIVLNMPDTDTLIGFYGDFAGLPHGQLLSGSREYDRLLPSKGFYSSNNDYIVLARKREGLEYEIGENDIIYWYEPDFHSNFDILKMFQVRLFNNERVVVEYDHATNTAQLRFEE